MVIFYFTNQTPLSMILLSNPLLFPIRAENAEDRNDKGSEYHRSKGCNAHALQCVWE